MIQGTPSAAAGLVNKRHRGWGRGDPCLEGIPSTLAIGQVEHGGIASKSSQNGTRLHQIQYGGERT